jgi:hypothetical protein
MGGSGRDAHRISRHDDQGGGHRAMADGGKGWNHAMHRALLLIGLTMEMHSLYTLQHSR